MSIKILEKEKVIFVKDAHNVEINDNEELIVIEIFDKKSVSEENISANIKIGKNSRVQYIYIISEYVDGEYKQDRRIEVGEGAQYEGYYFYFGGENLNIKTHTKIFSNSHATHNTFFFASKKQKFSFHETFEMASPESFARFFAKGLSAQSAESEYVGNVVVDPGAQKTDSRLEIQSFILGGEAKSNMVPQLRIEANNVKAGHAATIAKIQDDELFYLRTRGLNKKQAIQLFIEGLFLDAVKNIRHEDTKKKIIDMAKNKYISLK